MFVGRAMQDGDNECAMGEPNTAQRLTGDGSGISWRVVR